MGQEENGSERMRQLVEMAYGSGRGWQSPQTGYIHFSYNQLDEDYHHPIPVYENMLFALALMRSRSVENINEAKDILGRLLHFQNEIEGFAEGNFPVYLHEYPHCRDRQLAVQLIPVFYWMYKNFHHVLGADLKQRLEKALKSVLAFSLKTHNDREMSYPQGMKIAAGHIAAGRILECKVIEEEGNKLLSGYAEMNKPNTSILMPAWVTPSGIADLLLAFQMIYPSISKSPEESFWTHLKNTWHAETEAYCGPGWHESQRGSDPQPTLYDYFLGYFSGKCSYRSFLDSPVQLQAILVHPSVDEIQGVEYPLQFQGNIENCSWLVQQNQRYAYSLIVKPLEFSHAAEKAFHTLKLLWGQGCTIHSMVYQPTEVAKVDIWKEGGKDGETIILYVTLDPVLPNEKNQEISLFIDKAEGLQTKVRGSFSSTFQMGDTINLSDEMIEIELSFNLQEGSGQFFGHIMRGNRPSQIDLKGQKRFNAYDTQLFLRSIRRDEHCMIKVSIKLNVKE
ncbi:MAG: hypothetical protein H0U49_02050 [Parachlamydiaceae bacterium]|nr:hypothetical protein [Parachlamydiaceae bacterium]